MSTIFISHSSVDNALAKELLDWLNTQGYQSVFLDLHPDEGIEAGEHWEKVLYRELVSCSVVLALVTEAWAASKWCFAEATHARSGGKTMLGLTPNRDVHPAILSDTQLIDYSPENRTDAYHRLADALRRAIDPQSLGRWDSTRPLFPGLIFFDEKDAPIFFGRRRLGRAIYQKLRELQAKPPGSERLLLVFGPSGCGKSSLVRAGTLPHIRANPTDWITLGPFRPSEGWPKPLRESLDVLSGADEQTAVTKLRELAELLRSEADAPRAVILLIIDQFEEALDAKDGAETTFWLPLSRLLEPNDTPFMAMATLRSDFMGDFQKRSGQSSLRFGSFPIEPMSPNDLREVIIGPGRVAGITIEPGLVDALVDDASNEQALPLLALALNRLWLRYEDKQVGFTLVDYQDGLGGMSGLIDREAESALAGKGLREAAVLDAFMSLTRLVREGLLARQPAAWKTLEPEARKSLEPFVIARLLTKYKVEDRQANGADAKENDVVDLVHETVLSGWKRLQVWLGTSENRDFLLWREELRNKASRWAQAEDRKRSLLEGAELKEAKKWLKAKHLALNAREADYIQAGIDAKKISRKKIAVAAMVLAIAVSGVWGWTRTDIYQIWRIEGLLPKLIQVSAAGDESTISLIELHKEIAVTGHVDLARVSADRIEDLIYKADVLEGIAEVLTKSGQAEQATQAWEGVLATADKIEDTRKKGQKLQAVIKALAKSGQSQQATNAWQRLRASADKIKDSDAGTKAETFQAIAEALSKTGQAEQANRAWDGALAAADKIDTPYYKAQTLKAIVKALAESGQTEQATRVWDGALAAADKIGNADDKANTLTFIAKALTKSGQTKQSTRAWDGALAAADKIDSPFAKTHTLEAIAKALTKSGQAEKSTRAWDGALAAADKIDKPTEKSNRLYFFAVALTKSGQTEQVTRAWDGALAAADKIDNPQDKAFMLQAIVKALAEPGQAEQATRGWDGALAAAEKMKNTTFKARTLQAIAQALAESGQITRALVIVDKIDNPFDKAKTLQAIVKALAESVQTQQATIAWEDLRAAADKIEDTRYKAETLQAIAEALTNSGQAEQSTLAWDGALTAADKIEDTGKKAQTFQSIAVAQTKSGQAEQATRAWDGALAAANKIDNSYDKAQTLQSLAEALTKSGQVEQAIQAWDGALAATDKIDNSYKKAETLQAIVKALAGSGQAEQVTRAMAIEYKIEDSSYKAKMLHPIVIVLAESGYAEQAIRIADKIENTSKKANMLQYIAEVLTKSGQAQQATSDWEGLRAAADKINNSYDKANTLKFFAEALTKSGQAEQATHAWDGALAAADKIDDPFDKADKLKFFAEALMKSGQAEKATRAWNGALAAADKIDNSYYKAQKLQFLAEALTKSGQTEQATRAWDGTLAAADKIDNPFDRAETLQAIAEALTDSGQAEQATRAWDGALTAADKIEDTRDKAEKLQSIAKALTESGKNHEQYIRGWEGLLAAADKFDDSRLKKEVLAPLITSLANSGTVRKELVDETLRITESLSDQKTQSDFYADIAFAYAQLGEYRLARETANRAVYAPDVIKAYVGILKYHAIENDAKVAENLAKLEKEKKR